MPGLQHFHLKTTPIFDMIGHQTKKQTSEKTGVAKESEA
jgi:hypothetical protein